MAKGSLWRVVQFDTLRLRLIKLAARVVELKTQINVRLPPAFEGRGRLERARSGDLRQAARPPAASRHLRTGA